MKFRNSLYALAIAGACSASVSAQTLTYSFAEVSGNVVLTVSGSLNDLTAGGSGWSFLGTGQASQNDYFDTADFALGGYVSIYNSSTSSGATAAKWYGHSSLSPEYIGSASSHWFSGGSTTGDSILFMTGSSSFVATDAQIRLPASYTWGSALNSQTTYTSTTLASMGITGLNQNFSLGNGNTIVFTASSPSPVPEASGSVAGLGLAVAGLYQLRRRRQKTVTQ